MCMLAQYRGGTAEAYMVAVELERVRKIWRRSGNGMVVGLDESAGFMLGGFTTVIKMHAGGGRNAGIAKKFRRFTSVHRFRPGSDDRVDGVSVACSIIGVEFGSDLVDECLPLLVVLDADGEPFIFALCPVEALRAIRWGAVPLPTEGVAVCGEFDDLFSGGLQGSFDEGKFNHLPDAGPVAFCEGEYGGEHGVHACDGIHGASWDERWPAGVAGAIGESADLFHVHGETDPVAPGPVDTVGGDAYEDGLVVELVDAFPGEPPPFGDARTVVFDDDVCFGDELGCDLESFVGVEIEIDDAFSGVGPVVDGRPFPEFVLYGYWKAARPPHAVKADVGFDLRQVGAEYS